MRGRPTRDSPVFQRHVHLLSLGQRQTLHLVDGKTFRTHDEAHFVILVTPLNLGGNEISGHGGIIDAPEVGLCFDRHTVHLHDDIPSLDPSRAGTRSSVGRNQERSWIERGEGIYTSERGRVTKWTHSAASPGKTLVTRIPEWSAVSEKLIPMEGCREYSCDRSEMERRMSHEELGSLSPRLG